MQYHRISILFVITAVTLGDPAKTLSPRWDDMHTRHSWRVIPNNWECVGDPPVDTRFDLYIALEPYSENALTHALYNVSDPGHSDYGKYLSKEQVAELVAPHPHTLELVNSWLHHKNVPPSSVAVTHDGSTLTLADVSVTQANDLFDASYKLYRHIKTNATIVRTISYALPVALYGHVLTVAPTTTFSPPLTQWRTSRNHSSGAAAGLSNLASGGLMPVPSGRHHDDRDPTVFITPPILRSLYKTAAYVPAATNRNSLGILGLLSHYPSPSDLAAFMHKYRSDAASATYTVLPEDGGYDPRNPHPEANMDIQYAEAMAYPTRVVFFSVGGGFVNSLRFILEQQNIPQTISISYAYPEKDCSREYTRYVCNQFKQLTARGVSVLVGSGDHGVASGPEDCQAPGGSIQFEPLFPASCPYVTAVGGTQYMPEIAASFSGGGFSNHFPRPPYQQQAVSRFIQNTGSLYEGHYNTMGRGIPDTAAQAAWFMSFDKGIESPSSGTSCSTPVVAGIVSLLNDYRLFRGQPALGFLNPLLYGVGVAGLTDITRGSNPGCGTPGFSAVPGWDPVTGHGTPDFARLKGIIERILNVPSPTNTNPTKTNPTETNPINPTKIIP